MLDFGKQCLRILVKQFVGRRDLLGLQGVGACFVEAALFGSGRPVVVVPYIQKAPIKLDHIICCWDGSKTAARAIGDALPFLARANTVELLIVTDSGERRQEEAGADMATHLARWLERLPGVRTVTSALREAPAGSLFAPVDASLVFSSFVVASVVSTLALVPGGLGTFEAACVSLLHVFGVAV